MKSILILGHRGQVGQILQRELSKAGYSVLTYDNKIHPGSVIEVGFLSLIEKAEVIINCAAISNTRYCETHWQESLFINTEFPIWLAKKINEFPWKHLINLSTGCIFDGNKEPHYEGSKPTPHIAYSRQKLMAETIRWMTNDVLILRPRMIFSELPIKSNLLYKIHGFKHFLAEKNSMTAAIDLANFIKIAIEKRILGIYNFCNEGLSSPYEIKIMMQDILNWHYPIFEISKKSLHREIGLELTDTWLESNKLSKHYTLPPVEQRIREMIELSKDWLIPHTIEEIRHVV